LIIIGEIVLESSLPSNEEARLSFVKGLNSYGKGNLCCFVISKIIDSNSFIFYSYVHILVSLYATNDF